VKGFSDHMCRLESNTLASLFVALFVAVSRLESLSLQSTAADDVQSCVHFVHVKYAQCYDEAESAVYMMDVYSIPIHNALVVNCIAIK